MDLIELLTEKMGIDKSQAEQGAGLVFAKAKEHLGGDFEKLRGAVPDMDALLEKAPAADATEDSGGGGGGLMGMIGGAAEKFGLDNVGDMADMAAGFDKIGIGGGQLPAFATTLLGFLEEKLGVDAKALVEKFLKP